jgi:hypothetical protein
LELCVISMKPLLILLALFLFSCGPDPTNCRYNNEKSWDLCEKMETTVTGDLVCLAPHPEDEESFMQIACTFEDSCRTLCEEGKTCCCC